MHQMFGGGETLDKLRHLLKNMSNYQVFRYGIFYGSAMLL